MIRPVIPDCPKCKVKPDLRKIWSADSLNDIYVVMCPKCGYHVTGNNGEEVLKSWVRHAQGRDIHDAVKQMLD